MPTKLYVGNIPEAISSTELKELFEKYGKVLECDIIKDYAFVHMEDASKAKASIAALNDFSLKGNRIRVEMSTTQLRNSGRSSYSRRGDSPRRQSSSMSMRSSRREYPMMSSSRSGGYSGGGGGGGGGPDRSYPSMRSSYMDARSRPYDSPYERQRMPPPPPMSYTDPYSMRGGPIDMYGRDDFYQQRGPPMPMADHYGRGPPMRSNYDPYSAYPTGPSSLGPMRSRYAASPPSSRNGLGRYGSPPRSSSSRRPSRRSPPPPSSSNSSRSRR
ncbi:unnamed protein product [Adineta steineri]|uniref:RRM domain-containing protein n=1 Tax=Adineta steineri TaxID=433720 RepID=A0A818NIE2_9BILA|nr:unnamed protein product [Adineta steineri]CAF3607536.1 unnamed protein product [Adineta steineri]